MQRIQTLLEGCQDLNIDLDDRQKGQFLRFKELLQEWNQKIDITTIIEDEEVDIKHFLDCLTLVDTKVFEGNLSLIDIGTGGGFPGVPLKIYNGNIKMTLMDSLNKRISFLNEVISELGFENIHAIHGRAEEMGRTDEYREVYDICTSRAVAQLNVLAEYCLPFVKVGGYFISMKGPDCEKEVNEAKNSIKLLGGKLIDSYNVKIPKSDIEHSIVIIKKISNTPNKYPRGGGKPRKNPL